MLGQEHSVNLSSYQYVKIQLRTHILQRVMTTDFSGMIYTTLWIVVCECVCVYTPACMLLLMYGDGLQKAGLSFYHDFQGLNMGCQVCVASAFTH